MHDMALIDNKECRPMVDLNMLELQTVTVFIYSLINSVAFYRFNNYR